VELQSDTAEQIDENVESIAEWLKNYKAGRWVKIKSTADTGMSMDTDDLKMDSEESTTKKRGKKKKGGKNSSSSSGSSSSSSSFGSKDGDDDLTFEFDES